MSTDLRKARELFLHAVGKLPPEQWEAYIAEACGVDSDLAQQVAGLLQVHREAGSFLDAPAPGLDVTLNQLLLERPGTQIGPYKLLQQIGEGGMGVVYMAEQTEPVQRKVALKVIKPGMDTRQVIARFEAERQALGMMDHVNIARVLDAGATEQGRPYFVMELVHGVPITKYCDDNRLTPRQRLELFVPVCQAIQHAHQKGIIHRDIKPSNVMVTLYDGKPVPKVIDFGVAKATEQTLTERTLFTQYGTMVGTLEYMSPEQAETSALGVDTRSDIYSLGVLLYELLTGNTPLSHKTMKEAAYAEILRLIKEEEPPRPSTRLSDSGEALASISDRRHTEPAKLTKLMRGELDWIVMKTLEKDRNRRYETANGLAKDLQRYLADEPVLACPPSAGYRLRKFVRRNRGPVLAVSLVVLALVAGIIGTTWGMIRAEQARRNALAAQFAEAERADGERRAKEETQTRLAQIEKGTEILASVFRDLDPNAAEMEGVTLRTLLVKRLGEAAQQLEGEAVGDPLVVARLQSVLGISLSELGHRERAEGLLVKAGQTREQLLGADNLDTAATKHHLATLYREQGKYALAETLFKEVLAVRTAKLGADHPDTLTSQHHLALLYWFMKKFDLSIPLLEETLKLRKAKLDPDHLATLATQFDLGVNYCDAGRFADGIPLLEDVRQKGRKDPHLVAGAGNALLTAYGRAGKTTEATTLTAEQVRTARQQFPADSSPLIDALIDIGKALLDGQAYAEADPLLRESLSLGEKYVPDTWTTHHSRSLLGGALGGQEKYAAAEPLLLQGYAGLKDREATIPVEGKGYPTQALERLVQLYDAWGKPDEAAKWRKELEAHRKAAENSVKPKEN